MGASNVAKVFEHWPHLKYREKVALLFMANTALDADAPARFWGGWEALALALGLDTGNGSDDDAKRAAKNASEQVRRALAALAEAGAVVSSSAARFNIRAEYALALDPAYTFKPSGTGRQVTWEKVERDSTKKVESSHQKGGTDPREGRSDSTEKVEGSHQKGGEVPPERWEVSTEKVPPMSSEEELEEKREEEDDVRPMAQEERPPVLGLDPTPPEIEAAELKAAGAHPEAVDYIRRLRPPKGTNEYAVIRARLQRCRGLTGPEIWDMALSNKWVHQPTTPPAVGNGSAAGRTNSARTGRNHPRKESIMTTPTPEESVEMAFDVINDVIAAGEDPRGPLSSGAAWTIDTHGTTLQRAKLQRLQMAAATKHGAVPSRTSGKDGKGAADTFGMDALDRAIAKSFGEDL
jgi:hypothetical protein